VRQRGGFRPRSEYSPFIALRAVIRGRVSLRQNQDQSLRSLLEPRSAAMLPVRLLFSLVQLFSSKGTIACRGDRPLRETKGWFGLQGQSGVVLTSCIT
jgi:hypothetical protein